jgi:Deoxyribonuclease NucA/NucB
VRLRVRLRLAAVLSVTALSSAGLAALPAATGYDVASAAACQSQHNSVHVALSASRYPETTDHISDAIAAGQPSLLHIDRADEDAHRAASLADYPPRTGYDRDEYAPAMSREGGSGADVRYIDPSDNRGAGATMGNALEGWCEGQPFRIDITP